MILQAWRRRKAEREAEDAARALYLMTVEQARNPAFFADLGVPDSLDGRFETIALHAFCVMYRLKDQGAEAAALSQAYFDVMFLDMDRNLREMGVADTAIGKRMKKMMQGYYGRVEAYEAGIAADDAAALREALRRNLYGTVSPDAGHVTAVEEYMRGVVADLSEIPLPTFMAGDWRFPSPPMV